MTTTSRDRVLLMFLPALLVAIGYGWLILPSANRAAADAATRLANAQARMPSPQDLEFSRQQLLALRQEMDHLEGEKHQMREQWQALAARHGGAGRAHAGARLTDLLS